MQRKIHLSEYSAASMTAMKISAEVRCSLNIVNTIGCLWISVVKSRVVQIVLYDKLHNFIQLQPLMTSLLMFRQPLLSSLEHHICDNLLSSQ